VARFIGAPLIPGTSYLQTPALEHNEPPLPASFVFARETLAVGSVVRAWRSTNTDRGDTYLARHWFELRLTDGRLAVVYFDRKAKPRQPRWWLYTLADIAPSAR